MNDVLYRVLSSRSHRLVLDAYRVTARFPRSERRALGARIRTTGVSLATAVAGAAEPVDRARMLRAAHRRAGRLRAEVVISHDLGFLSDRVASGFEDRIGEVLRLIAAMRRRAGSDDPPV